MLAKLIVWGSDRSQAMDRLARALAELRIEGICTTVPLFRALLKDKDFLVGNLDIGMLDRKLAAGELAPERHSEFEDLAVIAASLEHLAKQARVSGSPVQQGGLRSQWRQTGRRESLRGEPWS
jgi:acetyl/propionyl-CoA carboxylase alpha subunit